MGRAVTAEEAASVVKSGMRVFVHGAAATPTPLLDALARRTDLEDVTLYHLHTAGPAPFAASRSSAGASARCRCLPAPPVRAAIERGDADFIPIFLSDIPRSSRRGTIPLDVALLQLSPPDRHGYCTLGTSVDAALAAARIRTSRHRRNQRADAAHARQHRSCRCRRVARLRAHRPAAADASAIEPMTAVERAIGEHVAALVEDGATLQMGIGAIPDAVLRALGDKHDLGVHTEMFSDGLVDLAEAGAITNRRKKRASRPHRHELRHRHAAASTTSSTTTRSSSSTPATAPTTPLVIRRQRRRGRDQLGARRSISPARCVADSIGHRIFSRHRRADGLHPRRGALDGGQADHRAALDRRGGTLSRIVPSLKPGAGVVTTRGHVHWVVTEYGAVNLFGLSLRQRGEALISIAHPDFRGELRRAFAAVRHVVLPGLEP